jgi:hypothetical protein
VIVGKMLRRTAIDVRGVGLGLQLENVHAR